MEAPRQPAPYDDELDLFELAAGLWRQRALIAGVTAGCVVLAALYAFVVATPSFEAETSLRPATAADLARINIASASASERDEGAGRALFRITPEGALRRVASAAGSTRTRRAVFAALQPTAGAGDAAAEESARRAFAASFSAELEGDNADSMTLRLTFRGPDPGLAAEAASALAREARALAREELAADFRATVGGRIGALEAELAAMARAERLAAEQLITRLREADAQRRAELEDQRKSLLNQAAGLRNDRMNALREAIAIAERLGIEKPTNLETLAAREVPGETRILRLDASGQGERELLFLRGTELLEAELRGLAARSDDRPYLPELREIERELELLEHNRTIEALKARQDFTAYAEGAADLQARISMLEGLLERDLTGLRVARTDRPAAPPPAPVAPRRILLLAGALVAGALLGALIALARGAAASRRGQPEPGDAAA